MKKLLILAVLIAIGVVAARLRRNALRDAGVGQAALPLNWCIGQTQRRILARSGGTNEDLLSRRR